MSVVPLPTKDDLFICLHISQRKNPKRYPRPVITTRALLPSFRLVANHGPKNSVWSTSTSRESCFASGDPGIEGKVEGWPDQVNEWFWHSQMCVCVERV